MTNETLAALLQRTEQSLDKTNTKIEECERINKAEFHSMDSRFDDLEKDLEVSKKDIEAVRKEVSEIRRQLQEAKEGKKDRKDLMLKIAMFVLAGITLLKSFDWSFLAGGTP